jgi:hypothetical protein
MASSSLTLSTARILSHRRFASPGLQRAQQTPSGCSALLIVLNGLSKGIAIVARIGGHIPRCRG